VDRDDAGGGSLALPGLCMRLEVPSGKDTNLLGVEDRLRKAREEFVRVFWEERNRVGVDSNLDRFGGEAKGLPGRVANQEGLVELGREGIAVGRDCRGRGGRVGDE